MKYERLVLVTRRTEQEELVARFQTRSQTEFYLTQSGQDFAPIARAHQCYHAALTQLRAVVPDSLKVQVIERTDLPRYQFTDRDVVATLGPDGLVANTARYLDGQPLIAVNPDPVSIDGILLPVDVGGFGRVLQRTLQERAAMHAVTMAEVVTHDGQRLRAVNDIFVGARTHVSARYRLEVGGRSEEHSSSGLIVSTGVGSTGWLRSVYAGAIGVVRALQPELLLEAPQPLPWDARELVYNVREPWPSMRTSAELVSGRISEDESLQVVSNIPAGGVIFADGMESDFLTFDNGARARVGIAAQALQLVRPD